VFIFLLYRYFCHLRWLLYISGLLEILFGLALFFKKWKIIGARRILMWLFLPIHVWDVFAEVPAIGS
jgi:uncharacterized membrane protein